MVLIYQSDEVRSGVKIRHYFVMFPGHLSWIYAQEQLRGVHLIQHVLQQLVLQCLHRLQPLSPRLSHRGFRHETIDSFSDSALPAFDC